MKFPRQTALILGSAPVRQAGPYQGLTCDAICSQTQENMWHFSYKFLIQPSNSNK